MMIIKIIKNDLIGLVIYKFLHPFNYLCVILKNINLFNNLSHEIEKLPKSMNHGFHLLNQVTLFSHVVWQYKMFETK